VAICFTRLRAFAFVSTFLAMTDIWKFHLFTDYCSLQLPTANCSLITANCQTYKKPNPYSLSTTSSRTICAEISPVIGLLSWFKELLPSKTFMRLPPHSSYGQTVHKFGICPIFYLVIWSNSVLTHHLTIILVAAPVFYIIQIGLFQKPCPDRYSYFGALVYLRI